MSADGSLQLIGDKKREKVNLDCCNICQKDKRSENLTENGRLNINAASITLRDDILSDLDENEINTVKYHLKNCYMSLHSAIKVHLFDTR